MESLNSKMLVHRKIILRLHAAKLTHALILVHRQWSVTSRPTQLHSFIRPQLIHSDVLNILRLRAVVTSSFPNGSSTYGALFWYKNAFTFQVKRCHRCTRQLQIKVL